MSKGRKPGQHFNNHKPAGSGLIPVERFTREHGWKRKLIFHEEKDYTLNLRCLAPYGRLGETLFHASLGHLNDKRRRTAIGLRVGMRYFSSYLGWLIRRGELPEKPEPRSLTSVLVAGFPHWLTQKSQSGCCFSVLSASRTYSSIVSTITLARQLFPTDYASDLVVFKNPLGHSDSLQSALSSRSSKPQPLLVEDYKKIQNAASAEALTIMAAPTATPTSARQLLPFYVLLLLRTCANPTSVREVSRDCLEAHPFDTGVWLIHFGKSRSGVGDAEDYEWWDNESADQLSPLNIIRFLQKWTEPLTSKMPRSLRNRLFIYYRKFELSPSGKGTNGRCGCFALDENPIFNALKEFIPQHELHHFFPKILRETGAVMRWHASHSIFQLKSLLNHARSSTTGHYLLSNGIQQTANEQMASGINAMTDAWTKGMPIVRNKQLQDIVSQDLHLSSTNSAKFLGRTYFTGLSDCSDPYHSPMPNQLPGKLCSAFWACISCGKAVVAREHLPLMLARRLAVREQIQLMNEADWKKSYGQIDEKLSAIINVFPVRTQEKATALMKECHLADARTDIITFLKTPLTY